MRVLRWISIVPIVFFLQLSYCGQVDPEPLEPGLLAVEVQDGQGLALSEASIFIDGVEQSRAAAFELEALVSYEVSVALEGWTFSPESQSVTLNPGEERTLLFTGTAETADLTVTAVDPFGVPVEGPVLRVNGEEQGQVPGTFTLGAGLDLALTLSWERWSFEPAETTVVLEPGVDEAVVFRAMDRRRTVIIDDFTNVGCVGCPYADEAIWGAVGEASGTIIPLSWHAAGPRWDPFYNYNPDAYGFRADFYFASSPSLPQVFVDGESVTATEESEILAAAEGAFSRDRRVTFRLDGSWDRQSWNLDGEGFVWEDPGAGPWRLYLVVYEISAEYEAGNLDEFRNVLRHVNGEGGEAIGEELELTAGESFSFSSSFSPDFDYAIVPPEQENLRAIVFIQHDGTKQILDAVEESIGGI